MKTFRTKLEDLAKSIVRAHKKWKEAEVEYHAHEWDFHHDPKFGEILAAAKKKENRLLDRLERMLI